MGEDRKHNTMLSCHREKSLWGSGNMLKGRKNRGRGRYLLVQGKRCISRDRKYNSMLSRDEKESSNNGIEKNNVGD